MQPDRWKSTAAILSAALTLLGVFGGCNPTNKYVPPPPPLVTVSQPVRRTVSTYIDYTGTTKPVETVDLRARVKGFLKEVHFADSADVKKGQLLMVIDEEPFKIKVEAAQAKVEEARSARVKAEQSKVREIAKAQLSLDQATLELAQIEARRNRTLLARNAGSREDVDKSEAQSKKAAAQVEADEASLEQAKADFETNILAAKAQFDSAVAALKDAQIDLGYCRIIAPIDGRISRKLVDVNNLVGDTEGTVLATIVDHDPIYAYVTCSEADLLAFRDMVRKGERIDFHQEKLPVSLGMLNEGGAFPHEGWIDYADPAVDPSSGTIQARAVFPNAKDDIFPGLFVRVRVPSGPARSALLVPEQAVQSDPEGPFLLTVDAAGKVERTAVTLGQADAGMRVIETGLTLDDRVIIDGLQKARPGLPVTTKSAETEPKPATKKPESLPAE